MNITPSISGQKCWGKTVFLLLCVGAPLFFLGGPGAHGARPFVALWDLGHVLFFSLFSWLLFRLFRTRFSGLPVTVSMAYVFCTVFIAGIAVEGLQMCFDGRTSDIQDVLRNQLGCLLTLAFVDTGRKKLSRKVRLPLQGSVVVLVVAAMFPLGRAAIDECIALKQFPLLSDFETPFEKGRWQEREYLSVSSDVARYGEHSLKVQLTTETYSGVGLVYFPGNWEGFENLYISVFLNEEGPLDLVCRVHDSHHSNEYTDRFNKKFILVKGWNDLVISLTDIQRAPVNRQMDMSTIENLKLFVVRQKKEKIIYIDRVYLGR